MAILIDSYSETNQDSKFIAGDATQVFFFYQVGQSFQGDGSTLDSCKFYVKTVGSPTGNVYARLYAHTGTFGSTGAPSGSALASSDPIDISAIPSSYSLVEFSFTGADRVSLTNGTYYFIAFDYSTGSGASNYVDVGTGTSGYTGNTATETTVSWIAQGSYDTCYYIYGETPTSSITGVTSVQGISSIAFS